MIQKFFLQHLQKVIHKSNYCKDDQDQDGLLRMTFAH